jgi:hypothetical protein
MKKTLSNALLKCAASLLGLLVFAAIVFLWVRSYRKTDSVSYRYSETGEVEFFAMDGTFSLGHLDGRFHDNQPGVRWYVHEPDDLEDTHMAASFAGFGWKSNAISRLKELHVRYWVVAALSAIVAAMPWMALRYSLRALLVSMAIFATMVGVSAATHRLEAQRKHGQKKPQIAEYDFGPFPKSFPATYAAALEKGTEFELLSLHPLAYEATPENSFHGWKVIGKTLITDDATRKQVVAAFNKGIQEGDVMADCFNPRHGIRVKLSERMVDFVICFECDGVEVFFNDKRQEGFACTAKPQSAFDEALTAGGAELAPRWDE